MCVCANAQSTPVKEDLFSQSLPGVTDSGCDLHQVLLLTHSSRGPEAKNQQLLKVERQWELSTWFEKGGIRSKYLWGATILVFAFGGPVCQVLLRPEG